jgi:TIR domain
MAKVFISYRSLDRDYAQAFASSLELLGHDPMGDLQTSRISANWDVSLLNDLTKSDAVVFLFTKQATGSENILAEVGAAKALHHLWGRPNVIPVVFPGGQLPEPLASTWAQKLPGIPKQQELASRINALLSALPVPPANGTGAVVSPRKKLFISHAAADKRLVDKFVELLEIGVGIDGSDIFYSSQVGAIENGTKFVEKILTALNNADFVISILSPDYLKSQFCIAETGAAMARQAAGFSGAATVPGNMNPSGSPISPVRFFSLVLPPARFSEIGGVLHGVQFGSIKERAALTELRELLLATGVARPISETKWATKLENFIDDVHRATEAFAIKEQISSGIVLEDVRLELSPELVHKRKIVFTLRNETTREVAAGPAHWQGDVPLQKVFSPLKMKAYINNKWSEDQEAVKIHAGGLFLAWITPAPSLEDSYLFGRCALQKLGKLRISLAAADVRVEKYFSF